MSSHGGTLSKLTSERMLMAEHRITHHYSISQGKKQIFRPPQIRRLSIRSCGVAPYRSWRMRCWWDWLVPAGATSRAEPARRVIRPIWYPHGAYKARALAIVYRHGRQQIVRVAVFVPGHGHAFICMLLLLLPVAAARPHADRPRRMRISNGRCRRLGVLPALRP